LGQPIGPIFKGQQIQEESHNEAKNTELGMATPKFHPPPTLITKSTNIHPNTYLLMSFSGFHIYQNYFLYTLLESLGRMLPLFRLS